MKAKIITRGGYRRLAKPFPGMPRRVHTMNVLDDHLHNDYILSLTRSADGDWSNLNVRSNEVAEILRPTQRSKWAQAASSEVENWDTRNSGERRKEWTGHIAFWAK